MRSLYLLFVVLSATLLSTNAYVCLTWDQNWIIREQSTGLVLDAGQPQVAVEFFDGYDSQLWQFQCSGPPGIYRIINKKTGHALDLDRTSSPNRVTTSKPDSNNAYQDWFINSDGTIANGGNGLALDVDDSPVSAGDWLEVSDSGKKFRLQARSKIN